MLHTRIRPFPQILRFGLPALVGLGTMTPAAHLQAQEVPAMSVDVELAFQSNYLDRGEDVMANYAKQQHVAYGANTGAWHFAPNITFHTPLEGMTFDLWMSFALQGRADRDVDGVLQSSPGGTDLLAEVYAPTEQLDALLAAAGLGSHTSLTPQAAIQAALEPNGKAQFPDCQESGCLPGLYKEEIGLARNDRIVFTWSYFRDTNLGVIGGGITSDGYLNSRGKGSPTTELFFSYSLPFLPIVTYEVYFHISDPDHYHNLSIGDSFDLNETFSLDMSIGVGYSVLDRLQGVQDVTAEARLNFGGFFVGTTTAWRPDLRFFDADTEAGSDSVPVWLIGGSSRADGLVADPSRQYGTYNHWFNAQVQSLLNNSAGADINYT
ncbi:MAG: hypothetical protein KDK39_00015 [Leptospiraceae bacterium]|nr:hypothetical protein [Leptospiraceae bacterium]